VPAAQHPGILSQRGDDVVNDLAFAARIALLVRDIYAFAADEPDSKHDAFHTPNTRRASGKRTSKGQPKVHPIRAQYATRYGYL